MNTKMMMTVLCGFLISCASVSSNESAPAEVPAIDPSVSSEQPQPVSPENSVAASDATIGMSPVSDTASTDTVPAGVEQVNVNPPAPDLKPVHPAASWTSSAPNLEPAHFTSEKKVSKKVVAEKTKAKSAKALKAEKAAKAKKLALAKKGKKGSKAVSKKLTKAECKKFAKNAKKHKKELAMCKAEQKKATAKNKKSGKVARG